MHTADQGFDVVVVGAGSGGAACAGLLVESTMARVCLIEAGPDYGSFAAGGWPDVLLREFEEQLGTHDWGYTTAHPPGGPRRRVWRGRVMGGCSSINDGVTLVGHAPFYDSWAELAGCRGWDWRSVRSLFDAARSRLGVVAPAMAEVSAWGRDFALTAADLGAPLVADLNDATTPCSAGTVPSSVVRGTRWNTAFAYIDPVRESGRLTIIAGGLAERIRVRNGRAYAVQVAANGQRGVVGCDRLVICCGAYSTPGLLIRSGIGDPDVLGALDIPVSHELRGVGTGLADHPMVRLRYEPGPKAAERLTAPAAGWTGALTLARMHSSGGQLPFDTHIFPYVESGPGGPVLELYVSLMNPDSGGLVSLTDTGQGPEMQIDHGYLTEPADIDRLAAGVGMARQIAAQLRQAGWLGRELEPGADVPPGSGELADWARRTVLMGDHGSCTCRMGAEGDPMSVVNGEGRLHGIENAYLCDASIFPAIPAANTHLPVSMLAHRLAQVAREW